MNEILDCLDVIKIYESKSGVKVPALRGLDLTIHIGDFITIVGPSGAGKTTFIKILGLFENFSSGEIILNCHLGHFKYSEITSKEKVGLRRDIFGYLLQLPEKNLMYHLTTLRNITFPMKIKGILTYEQQKTRAHELLTILNLKSSLVNKYPSKLSGGEAQRLGICIALANDPQIVLADEPTGELDSSNTYSILEYFKMLNKELGKTFVVVTHDQRFTSAAETFYRMQDGRMELKKERCSKNLPQS